MKKGVLDRTADGRHVFTIVVGDWSCDGHCRQDTYILASNVPRERFLECLEQTERKIRLRIRSMHEGYEVRVPTSEQLEILKREKLLAKSAVEEEFPPRYLLELVIAMAKRADPAIEVALLEIPWAMRSIGYGLYR